MTGSRRKKIYDPDTGRLLDLEKLIVRLGTLAIAKKYRVSPATVYKWRRGLHNPAKRTITRSSKQLF